MISQCLHAPLLHGTRITPCGRVPEVNEYWLGVNGYPLGTTSGTPHAMNYNLSLEHHLLSKEIQREAEGNQV
jgi:hypothetical protein